MELESYEITAGWQPNEVYEAAKAYLDAAEATYRMELDKSGFWTIQQWFVVHHLSVIASELFVKSFRVTVRHPPVTEESGPDYETVEHAYNGHNLQLSKLQDDDQSELQSHLTKTQLTLIKTISAKTAPSAEIARGRYPYQVKKGQNDAQFPNGDAGRIKAEEWLDLARALSKFKQPV